MRKSILAVSAAAALSGCDGDAGPNGSAAECIAEFSVDKGFSLDGDPGGCPPEPGCGTAAFVERMCADEGHPCDIRVTREAAVCIAEAEGLAEGIAPWTARVVYNFGHLTAIWAVQNTTFADGAHMRGTSFTLDATTGELLEELIWEQIP